MTSYGDPDLFTAIGRTIRRLRTQAAYRRTQATNAWDGTCGIAAVAWMAVRHLLPRRRRP